MDGGFPIGPPSRTIRLQKKKREEYGIYITFIYIESIPSIVA